MRTLLKDDCSAFVPVTLATVIRDESITDIVGKLFSICKKILPQSGSVLISCLASGCPYFLSSFETVKR